MENRRFNLDDYETVETRLEKFWEKFPNGRVATELLVEGDVQYIVFAKIYRDISDAEPFATGYAQERIGVGMVNKTSALENCETSAIGRALANGGFASKGKRPSREEMQKVERAEASSSKPTRVKAPKAKETRSFTDEELAQAFDSAKQANDKELLRAVWDTYSHCLDGEKDGITLRDFILLEVAKYDE